MHICFVVEGYPTDKDPFMPFVRNFLVELVRQGVQCSVIAPQSITRAFRHHLPIRPNHWKDYVTVDKYIDVYQPSFITISGLFPTYEKKAFTHASKTAYSQIEDPIDALYGHFWHMGVVASNLDYNKPVFVACGESRIIIQKKYSAKELEVFLKRLTGVIYVSTKSYKEAKEKGLQINTPYIVAPNGYNPNTFSACEKVQCRKELNWPIDKYVVCFVGAFNERKGSQRVSEAISHIQDPVYSCFIGRGDAKPTCNNILFCGTLANEEISKYLSASDVFVLPTNNEGCCNAIIEAMACGLPIISSNQAFNDDILKKENSIRINPNSIQEIQEAIEQLRDETVRNDMSKESLKIASMLKMEQRAKTIISFISKQI